MVQAFPMMSIDEATKDFRRRYIVDCLEANKGNMRETAKQLGLSRSRLYRAVLELQIDPKQIRRKPDTAVVPAECPSGAVSP